MRLEIKLGILIWFLVAAAFFLPAAAEADERLISWEQPMERENGTPLAEEEIAATLVCIAPQGLAAREECLETLRVPSPASEVTYNFPFGRFAVQARTEDIDGKLSKWTEPVLVKNLAPPTRPTSLSVE